MPLAHHGAPRRTTLAEMESAIVGAELELTLNLVRLLRCKTAEQDTTAAEAMVAAAQVYLASLHQSRDKALEAGAGH
jgi:hypothetical protein